MEWFNIIVRLIGHLAWPVAVILIVNQFGDELKRFMRRIKNAKYKGVELDLSSEIHAIKTEAEYAGITIAYPSTAFPEHSIKNIEAAPEWAFIKSWQDTENVLMQLYSKTPESHIHRGPISRILGALVSEGIIDQPMADLIDNLRKIRNAIVHAKDSEVTRGEALEWLGIAKSVTDRLAQKL